MVGIVVVSHSAELASGLSVLAAQMAGPDVAIEPAGGIAGGGLGTDAEAVSAAIERAGRDGDGVVVLGDLGSSILTVRALLEEQENGRVQLADAPIVEGAVTAAVTASAGADLATVLKAAEEARDARKL
ncbi:PEP-dependent dihydroxyacetone kinase, phosphoryl donor subunit DhaM [Baekduia alba]|uniref:dihydroxyacetone kinase phosphoryl donor subunit DhaM n=1 Tax=Baekduia alba TaxID=2997333 RepID=UPI0023402A48|nr:dihydroxyacetone kinase phosphoryl donor subunit DhaM [Baekduia alba]WCB92608.1 PEP-dependent dihydroxyacetone kinase, phosphoryl donor subunit DhaM [Baekduia alba]